MALVDLLAWQRAMLRTGDLAHTAKATLAALATWADNDTFECFRTQDALADELGLKERAIRNHLAAAVEAGWLVKIRRGASGRATDYRLAFGRVRDSANRQISAGADGEQEASLEGRRHSSAGTGGNFVPVQAAPQCRPPTHAPTDLTTDIEIRPTTSGGASMDNEDDSMQSPLHKALYGSDDLESGPGSLPADWHQNGLHVNECRTHGLYANPLARDFKKWATGKTRTNWDTCFMTLIRWIADGAEAGDNGFCDFEEHSQHHGHDDWADRYSIRFYADK